MLFRVFGFVLFNRSLLVWEEIMDLFSRGFVVGVIVITALFMLLLFVTNPYRKGQIEALTGDVRYELVVQPDSSKIWKRRK